MKKHGYLQGFNYFIFKKLQRKTDWEKSLEKKNPTSQLYIYFSSNFYTLSLKRSADVNEHSHKKHLFFWRRNHCQARHAHCRAWGREGLAADHSVTQAVKARCECGLSSHVHWCHVHTFPRYRPGWRGVCCLCDFSPAEVLSVSPLVSGITNHCLSLVFSCCTFSQVSKRSNCPNSTKQKSETRSVLHYSCCQSRNQKSKFSF